VPTELPLSETHRRAGAVCDEREGWLVPRHYGDPDAEYRALCESAGLADRSDLGKVEVTGRDRASFLHGMLTSDVKALAAGQGGPAAFLDAHGKVMSLLVVYALEDRLWLELPPATTEKFLETIDHFLISEKAYLESADAAFAVLSLQGPGARALLEAAGGAALDLAPCAHAAIELSGHPARAMARADGRAPGYHVWVPAAGAEAAWQALVAAGARPVGADALEVARVEAGQPRWGRDVDGAQIFPELRLDDHVSFTKGCYIGQEVVARVKYRGHVNRALTGLVLEGERVPAPGAPVVADVMGEIREVGRVTSAARSPGLGRVLALGYVRREHLDPGTAVTVRDQGAAIAARVAALPFAPPA
jgi:folate-binding protein YgfZ